MGRAKLVQQLVLLVAISICLFLVSDLPLLGVVLPSLRASWRSLKIGVWLFTVDPQRWRGVICGLFCLAMGCWQAAATAVLSLGIIVLATKVVGRAPNMERFVSVMSILVSGVALTSLLGLLASLAALCARIRVWVHPALLEMLDRSLKLATERADKPAVNYAVFVLATSLAVPVLGGCGFVLMEPGSTWRALAVFGLSMLTVLVAYACLAGRIIAECPSQCWESDSGHSSDPPPPLSTGT